MWALPTEEYRLIGKSYVGPAESETLCMRGRSMLENRETSEVFGNRLVTGAVGEGLWP